MGGFGSGRGSRWAKTTTESQHRIDIRWLKKQGYLQPGPMMRIISWSIGDEQTGCISFQIENNCMILSYRFRPQGGEWEDVKETITFARTPCNYGGERIWFWCPHCWKRVAVLYGAGKYFLCRHCHNLAYSSQQEGNSDRLMRKARKIRRRLGASENLFESIWFKPKNMHQKTFDRLRREADYANNLSWLIAGQRLGIHI
jgi:hypothetical protein